MAIELVLPAGDQSDLEIAFERYMIANAIANPWFAFNNQWGTSYVQQGSILHGIEWSYVGVEEDYDQDDNVIGHRWESGEPDFQIDCSWHEE